MIIATIGVGLLAAYYFGVQAGIWAGAATLALMFAALIPQVSSWAYAVLVVGVGALAFLGPRYKKPGSASGVVELGRALARKYGGGLFGGGGDGGGKAPKSKPRPSSRPPRARRP